MVDIHSATAEIRQGQERQKEDRNHRAKNIIPASATQGGHIKRAKSLLYRKMVSL